LIASTTYKSEIPFSVNDKINILFVKVKLPLCDFVSGICVGSTNAASIHHTNSKCFF